MASTTPLRLVSRHRLAAVGLLTLSGLWIGCADDAPPSEPGGFNNGGSSGSGASSGSAGTSGDGGVGGSSAGMGGAGTGGVAGSAGSGGTGGSSSVGDCSVQFEFKPEAGTTVASVAVAGEWNGFDEMAMQLSGPDSSGARSKVSLTRSVPSSTPVTRARCCSPRPISGPRTPAHISATATNATWRSTFR